LSNWSTGFQEGASARKDPGRGDRVIKQAFREVDLQLQQAKRIAGISDESTQDDAAFKRKMRQYLRKLPPPDQLALISAKTKQWFLKKEKREWEKSLSTGEQSNYM
jgi:hypothetical protein